MKKHLFLFTFFLVSLTSNAQDWIGAIPTRYNPSFAGSAGTPRVSSFTSYFPSYKNITQQTAGDFFINKISTGIGVSTLYDHMPNYNNFKTELILAPKISIKGKYTISPSVSGTYGYTSFNLLGIRVVDKNDPLIKNRYDSWDYRTGLLFNSKRFYAGYTYENRGHLGIIRDNLSYIQAGYSWGNADSKNAFSIQTYAEIKNGHDQLKNGILNFTVRHKKIIVGTGLNAFYRSGYFDYSGLFSGMAGIQTKKLRIMYVLMDSGGNNAGNLKILIHNLGIRYQFGNPDNTKNLFTTSKS